MCARALVKRTMIIVRREREQPGRVARGRADVRLDLAHHRDEQRLRQGDEHAADRHDGERGDLAGLPSALVGGVPCEA